MLTSAAPLLAQAWQQQSPLPSDQNLNGVAFPTPVLGFAVGDDFVLLQTQDGGKTWSQAPGITRNPAFLEDPFRAVDFLDAQRGWVIGNNDHAYRTADGGQSWQRMTGFPAGSYDHLAFVSPTHGWAGGNGSVVRTRDGGTTWTVLTWWDQHGIIRGLDFADDRNGLFASDPVVTWPVYPEGIYRTQDGGDTWTQTWSGYAGAILFLDASTVLAAGGGGYLRSADGGASWSSRPWSFAESPAAWCRIDAATVLAAGSNGSLYRSADAGLSWTLVHEGPEQAGYGWSGSFSPIRSAAGSAGRAAGSCRPRTAASPGSSARTGWR